MASDASPERCLTRRFRVGLALIALTLSIVFAGFWARGYRYQDQLCGGFRQDQLVWLKSWRGVAELRVDEYRMYEPPSWHWSTIAKKYWVLASPPQPDEKPNRFLGFACRSHAVYGWQACVPYWFLTATCGVTAVAAVPKPRWRFSLRRLLVVTTLLVAILGLMVSLPKDGAGRLSLQPLEEPAHEDFSLPVLPGDLEER
jgi:hypothetical protein